MSWLSSHIIAFTAAPGLCGRVCREGHPDRSHLWHLYTHSCTQKPVAGATNHGLTHTLRRRTVCVSVHTEMRSGAMGVRRDI